MFARFTFRACRCRTAPLLRGAGVLLAPLLLGAAGCGGTGGAADRASDGASAGALPTAARTPTYVAEVVAEYPHDRAAFTQGLVWHDGRLFESTGQVGSSDIREVELRTGRVLRRRALPAPHFGEGIAILGDRMVQLTWTSGVAFAYDWRSFTPRGQFRYEGEGWGLTTDGSALVMSNGSATIVFRDPATFAEQRRVAVTDHDVPVGQLNELEWVGGELWANVWMTDQIARIDPATGAVTGWIDLSGLLSSMDRRGTEDVLNGIAYDAAGDRYFVTGKLWPKLFEIRLTRRS